MYFTNHQKFTWGKVPPEVDASLKSVIEVLGMLLKPSETVELRVEEQRITSVNLVANGYFNDPVRLARAALRYQRRAELVKVAVNPIRFSLIESANNRLRQPAVWTSRECDVVRRRTLTLKFEPSPTVDADSRPVFARAQECMEWLTAQGWPSPIVARADYETHLLYSVDMPVDMATVLLVSRFLENVAHRFDDEYTRLQKRAFWANTLCPLYGLTRHSSILVIPSHLEAVSPALLEALSPSAPVIPMPEPERTEPTENAVSSIDLFIRKFSRTFEPIDDFLPSTIDYNLPVASESEVVNGLDSFLRQQCHFEPNGWTPTHVLYAAYQTFCGQNSLQALSISQFGKML